MARDYFNTFSIIDYKGYRVRDILSRPKILELNRQNAYLHPYTVKYGERPDMIASEYYGTPKFTWLIWLANDMTDPYYDWYLTNEDFDQSIIKKYGSLEEAKQKIKYYQNNWRYDDSIISVSAYVALPIIRKKYWSPILNNYNNIVSFQRKHVDWTLSETSFNELYSPGKTHELEGVYYSPVYAYDWENDLNESRKNIVLIDNGLAPKLDKELQTIMRR